MKFVAASAIAILLSSCLLAMLACGLFFALSGTGSPEALAVGHTPQSVLNEKDRLDVIISLDATGPRSLTYRYLYSD